MAISAEIAITEIDGENLILHLRSTPEYGGGWSMAGQPQLTILNYTHVPAVGQVIWGGSGFVTIEAGMGIEQSFRYERIGYTRLKELITT
jgi:hypothetical protein